ncbi:MAG: HAD-IA family hydrolase [Deltaproteobacteria bacterium]|nr:HAD-IA family hydrolase [Deltaproteobacteria bacterium]
MARPQLLIFDVNETLLDLTELRSVLTAALGGGERLAEWFFRLLHGSLVANATDSFRSLPPHADVSAGLDRLANAGFRLIALSNGSPIGIPAQLTNAGIIDRFEMVVSVEEAGRFKPDPAPYRLALERAAVDPGQALMVAAHDWDIIGARAVGIPGAFIARPGVVWTVPHELPKLTPADIGELAAALDA